MTIPTRDELIERIADCQWNGMVQVGTAVSFTDSEIRRAVAEELEALRDEVRLRGAVVTFSGEYERGAIGERRLTVNRIDARLAALRASQGDAAQRPEGAMRQTEHPAPSGAKPSSPRVDAGSSTGPAQGSPSDADVLERAAELLRESGWREATPDELLSLAEKRRAASAPKPVDVFRAFSMWTDDRDHKWIEGHARDWFGPLVAALEKLPPRKHLDPYSAWLAQDTLHALRQRAQEASK